jgi:acylphosphatase
MRRKKPWPQFPDSIAFPKGREFPVPTKSLLISGRVQGVGFRYTALHEAQRLGVTGWVRNELDGSVHMVAQGSEVVVVVLEEWCRTGPTGAIVQEVQVSTLDTREVFRDFRILR